LGEQRGDGGRWVELVGEQRLGPDAEHEFLVGNDGEPDHSPRETAPDGDGSPRGYTHVKMTIIPDGGVKRLRVFGVRA
jgi:allantoicase